MIRIRMELDCVDPPAEIARQFETAHPKVEVIATVNRPNGHYEVELRGSLFDVHAAVTDSWTANDPGEALKWIDEEAEVL